MTNQHQIREGPGPVRQPEPGPMLTNIHDAIWRHMATINSLTGNAYVSVKWTTYAQSVPWK